jgi:hypothetical protein
VKSILQSAAHRQAEQRLSALRSVGRVSCAPGRFTSTLKQSDADVWKALRFFMTVVGLIIVIETVFSFVFNTAFSDLVHHFFPALVALTGGFLIYALLKLSFTRGVIFSRTLEASLYIGGTALAVMITSIFALLSIDFGINYQSVMSSGCDHRTIMCLLSGNTQSDYGLMQDVATLETQGGSFSFIMLTIFACLIYYTGVLAMALKRLMGVAIWRTLLTAMISVVVLTPAAILLLNTVYRLLYPAV